MTCSTSHFSLSGHRESSSETEFALFHLQAVMYSPPSGPSTFFTIFDCHEPPIACIVGTSAYPFLRVHFDNPGHLRPRHRLPLHPKEGRPLHRCRRDRLLECWRDTGLGRLISSKSKGNTLWNSQRLGCNTKVSSLTGQVNLLQCKGK